MKIVKHGPKEWENLHTTFKQNIADLYDVANDTSLNKLEAYNDTTAGIQNIIDDCSKKGKQVRALGGCWSLSPVMATSGILINTRFLNMTFTINESSVADNYQGKAEDLFFAQCGTSIWELNERLFPLKRSLRTCGASNGQTIVGAMSTGTHGSAIDVGAIQDYIKGIHLITGPHSHVYLQRESYPVINKTFTDKIGADLIESDALFNAVLVSMGSMGFIHGVMIETDPLFLLECYMRRVPFDEALFQLMENLDFKHPQLPFPNERPFQFQVMIDPYDLKKGVRMTTMYKRDYTADHGYEEPDADGIGPGDDAPCFLGKMTDAFPGLTSVMVTGMLAGSLKPYEAKRGTLAEIFTNFQLKGKVASAAIGVSAKDCVKAIKLLLEINKSKGPFVGLFACRFVKKSEALLAFTKFDFTCIIELDGVLTKKSLHFYEEFCDALEEANIPFTYHWGKINSLNEDRVKRMYGDKLLQFVIARYQLLEEENLLCFNNTITKNWGFESKPPREDRGVYHA